MNSDELINGFTGFSANKGTGFKSSGMGARAEYDMAGFSGGAGVGPSAATLQSIGKYLVDGAAADGEPARFDPDKLASISDVERRWAWVEINLNAIRQNTMAMRTIVGTGRRMMAVLKSDAYGHGVVRVAKTVLNSGADYLGVSSVDEGVKLREALVNAPILVLSEPPASAIPLLLGYKIMPSIYTPEFAIQYAECADACGMTAPYHLALNTGMNRIGVEYADAVNFLMAVSFHRALDLKGVFTQFATSNSEEEFDFRVQVRRFIEAIEAIRASGFNPGLIHCADSAATIRYPNVIGDMARVGSALYGLHPCPDTRMMVDLQQVMSVHARITDVRHLAMSEGVSYGMHYRSRGSATACTIPVGFADGLPRSLSGRTDVILGGTRCHQVGDICMDQCMFEVDMRSHGAKRVLEPQVGDEVLLVGRQGNAIITLDDLAATAETTATEIACGFGLRLPRIYR